MEYYRHKNSEKHLFLFTISFIASVFAIRIFLELTGYFQLGGGVFHIAHVLWGGLAMIVAGIMLIVYQGDRIYAFSSVLLGIGFGFFIDEVGKFITNDNNYFFAPAAAIIYTFMVFSFLVTYYFKRTRKIRIKEEMIFVLEELKDLVSGSFHINQKNEIVESLEYLKNNASEADIKNLAEGIDKLIKSGEFKIKEPPKSTIAAFVFKLEKKVQNFFFRVKLAELTVLYYLLIRGVTSLIGIIILNHSYFVQNETLGTELSPIYFGSARTVLLIYTALNSIYIISLFYSFILLARNKVSGLKLARSTQIYSILLINVFAFYFEQFSAAIEALLDITSVYLMNILLKKQKRNQ